MMTMTSQALPTDMTNLFMLNEFSGHCGYYPRHSGYGYGRRHRDGVAPRRYGRRTVRAPVATAPLNYFVLDLLHVQALFGWLWYCAGTQ